MSCLGSPRVIGLCLQELKLQDQDHHESYMQSIYGPSEAVSIAPVKNAYSPLLSEKAPLTTDKPKEDDIACSADSAIQRSPVQTLPIHLISLRPEYS